jgi:hypothetical protein
VYHGHLGRKRVRALVDARASSSRAAVRHFAATRIASAFKGAYSRKYIHDFNARKRYIAAIAARGDALRAELEAAHEAALAVEVARRDTSARADFAAATAGLHHLTSTAAQPGVYNPPWAARASDVPSAFGVPLEVHLRAAMLRTLRTRGLHSTRDAAIAARAAATAGGALDASVVLLGHTALTAVPGYAGAASRQSVQATAPYDAARDAARAAARATKLKNLDTRPLLAGTAGRLFGGPPVGPGVHAAVPYEEPWLAARSDRELEATRFRHRRVAAAGAPFVAASSRASRLFEDAERAAAVKAATLLAAGGGRPPPGAAVAPGGPVASVRIGDALLRPMAPSSAAAPAPAGAPAGSAVAAARDRRAPPAFPAVDIHVRTGGFSRDGGGGGGGGAAHPSRAPCGDASPGRAGAPPLGASAAQPVLTRAPPVPELPSTAQRRRPLMKLIPSALQRELGEGVAGRERALASTIASAAQSAK